MKLPVIRGFMLGPVIFFVSQFANAHPTGNMITVGESVLWSYINPINDLNHYACVMIWTKGTDPRVYMQSDHAASDYMLYNKQEVIYIIERKFLRTSDEFQVRVLKSEIGREPIIIWDWFEDDYRIGEGGFFMLSDHEMIFGKYPNIYALEKGGEVTKYFEFEHPIKRIRAVEDDQILLLGDSSCYLVRENGAVVRRWHELIDQEVVNAPMNRNQVFDADYSDGELLFSYWGRRSFDLIDAAGNHQIILQQADPLIPHWVTFWNGEKLLFSSSFIFDGSTPEPHLLLFSAQGSHRAIWSTQ